MSRLAPWLRIAIAAGLLVAAAANATLYQVTVRMAGPLEAANHWIFGALRMVWQIEPQLLPGLEDIGTPHSGRLLIAGWIVLVVLGLVLATAALIQKAGPSALRALSAALAAGSLVAFRTLVLDEGSPVHGPFRGYSDVTHHYAPLAHGVFAAVGALLLAELLAWIFPRVSSPA